MMEQQTIPGIKPSRADKVHADRAAKQAAYRAAHKLKAVTIQLPADLCERMDDWFAAHPDKPKSATLAKLIESQLLRKR